MVVGFDRKDSLGYGIESTEGTREAAVAGTMIYASDVEMSGIHPEIVEREYIDDSMGPQAPRVGVKVPGIGFKAPLRGAGDTSTNTRTAPEIGELMKTVFGTEDLTDDGTIKTTTGSNTTTIEMDTNGGANFTIGHAVFISNGTDMECAWITAIASDALTVTPALSFSPGDETQVYSAAMYKLAASGTHQSLTFDYYDGDSILHSFLGCKGNVQLVGNGGEAPMGQFAFMAMNHAKSADADGPGFTPSYDATVEAVIKNARFFIGATSYLVKNVTLDLGQITVARPDQNSPEFVAGHHVTNRKPLITIEGLEVEDITHLTTLEGPTPKDVTLQWGRTLGNIVAARCKNAYFETLEEVTEDGKKLWNGTMKAIKTTGNDEVALAYG